VVLTLCIAKELSVHLFNRRLFVFLYKNLQRFKEEEISSARGLHSISYQLLSIIFITVIGSNLIDL